MYDYGNNTMQFLQNAMQTINTAKQYGYNQMAGGLTQSMFQVADSSSKSISEYAQAAEQWADKHSQQQTRIGAAKSGQGNKGGSSHGGGSGRGR